MKKQPRKLALKTDTVRKLNLDELALAAGGGSNTNYGCDGPTSTRTNDKNI